MSEREPNTLPARPTAAYALEMGPRPIPVSVRARFAERSAASRSRSITGPVPPSFAASESESLTCPVICGSPSTCESSPHATRNRCRTESGSRYA